MVFMIRKILSTSNSLKTYNFSVINILDKK